MLATQSQIDIRNWANAPTCESNGQFERDWDSSFREDWRLTLEKMAFAFAQEICSDSPSSRKRPIRLGPTGTAFIQVSLDRS